MNTDGRSDRTAVANEDDVQEGSPLLTPLVPTADQRVEEALSVNTNDDGTTCDANNDVSHEGSDVPSHSGREHTNSINEGGEEGDKRVIENGKGGANNVVSNRKVRRLGTTLAPAIVPTAARQRKISFADDVEQRIPFTVPGDSQRGEDVGLTDITQDVIPEVEDREGDFMLSKGHKTTEEAEEEKDRFPFLSKREARYSTTSRFSLASHISFSGLTSRASMASLRSTITKVHSELYPERGSFVATSLGQSFAEFPAAIAQKLYIVTQVLAAVSVSIGSMAVGFSAAYTSPALASMDEANSTLILTPEQKSWVGSLMPLSALTGSIIGGYLVDALGRKMLILVCGPPIFAAMIIIGSALNVWMLYVGRTIVGLCVGLLTLTLPVYLGETIQPEIRGTLGLLPTTIGNAGILMCFVVGSYVNWSWLAYTGAIIPLIFFCLMIFVPETPRWYVSKGQHENAEKSLQWLRGSDNDVEYELDAIQQNFEISASRSSSIKDLFNRQYLKPLALSIGLMLVQQLSGINAVIFYTVDIFKLSGSKIDDNLCTIIVGIVNFLSTFLANILIDKLGRKILLYVSDVAMIISLFTLGAFFYVKSLSDPEDVNNEWNSTVDYISWLPLVSFMVYVIAFSLGWGPIPWLFMGEVLPAKIRGPAASLVTSFNWGCTFIVTKTFPGMLKKMGAHSVFFMFGVVMVVGLFFSILFVPETKGKTLEELEAQLSGRPNPTLQRRHSEISGIVIK